MVELFRQYREREHREVLSSADARARLEEFTGGESLETLDEDEQPRLILVAGSFRAGVTNTVLWLIRNFGLDITCVQLLAYSVNGSLVLASTVLIPLPEAADFEVRLQEKRRRASEVREGKKIDFDAARDYIAAVPPGRWTTYRDVAIAGGSPGGAQAIGTCCSEVEGFRACGVCSTVAARSADTGSAPIPERRRPQRRSENAWGRTACDLMPPVGRTPRNGGQSRCRGSLEPMSQALQLNRLGLSFKVRVLCE